MVTSNKTGKEEIRNIGVYKDANIETISRSRSGMIDATIHKRPRFENSRHFIMPMKNDLGKCRFYYKSNTGIFMAKRGR